MISQTNPPIEVLAVLLCAPASAARGNRAAQRAACVLDSFSPCSSYIPGRTIPTSPMAAEGISSKVPAPRPAEANG